MKIRIVLFIVSLLYVSLATAAQEGYCELTAKGAENFTIRIPSKPAVSGKDSREAVEAFGKNSATSEYWMHASTVQGANKTMDNVMKKTSKPGDRLRIINSLLVNCGNKEILISIAPKKGTSQTDAPFGPKRYKIALDRQGKPGDFTVLAAQIKTGYYDTSAPGTLDITQFDATGVKGNFSVTLAKSFTKPTQTVTLTGNFHFPCNGNVCK